MISLQEVKKMFEEDPDLTINPLGDSRLGKLIRKREVSLETIVFIYRKITRTYIKDEILMAAKMTFKEALESGWFCVPDSEMGYSGWMVFFENCPAFFESAKDLHDYVLENFEIDLDLNGKIPYPEKNVRLFSSMLRALFGNGYVNYMSLGNKDGNFKEIYAECFEYILKLNKIRLEEKHPWSIAWEDVLRITAENNEHIPAINFDVFVEYINKYVPDRKKRADIIMEMYSGRLSNKVSHFNTITTDVNLVHKRLLPLIKDLMGDEFPVKNSYYSARYTLDKNFFSSALTFLSRNVEELMSERSVVFRYILYPLLNDTRFKTTILNNYFMFDQFVETTLLYCDEDKLDEVYIKLKDYGYNSGLLCTIFGVASLNNNVFKPTELIAEEFINDKERDWATILIPEDKFYDMDYIAEIAKAKGTRGVLFGNFGWNGNEYVANRIDLDKVPEEFFEKYKASIDWESVSMCKKMSLKFMKRHREKIRFDNLYHDTCVLIDDELATWLAERVEGNDEYTAHFNCWHSLSKAKNLSMDFMVKYLDNLVNSDPCSRFVKKENISLKLADLVGYLS